MKLHLVPFGSPTTSQDLCGKLLGRSPKRRQPTAPFGLYNSFWAVHLELCCPWSFISTVALPWEPLSIRWTVFEGRRVARIVSWGFFLCLPLGSLEFMFWSWSLELVIWVWELVAYLYVWEWILFEGVIFSLHNVASSLYWNSADVTWDYLGEPHITLMHLFLFYLISILFATRIRLTASQRVSISEFVTQISLTIFQRVSISKLFVMDYSSLRTNKLLRISY